jgi:PBP1b-binding outer membrane lipoprotein LpoB
MRKATVLTMLAGLALVFAGCASMSDEERCKKEGGVWRGSICERQAR